VSRKMSTWVGQYAPLELFCLWTKVHQISFAQRKLSKIPKFCMFLAPHFGGEHPRIFGLTLYKAHPFSDHVAKFLGDRSMDLGEQVTKLINRVKHKPVRNYRWPNKHMVLIVLYCGIARFALLLRATCHN